MMIVDAYICISDLNKQVIINVYTYMCIIYHCRCVTVDISFIKDSYIALSNKLNINHIRHILGAYMLVLVSCKYIYMSALYVLVIIIVPFVNTQFEKQRRNTPMISNMRTKNKYDMLLGTVSK